MTVGGFNMGGDLDLCVREADPVEFAKSVKKLAAQRNVSERTIMLWCYQRAENLESINRIREIIQKEDQTGRWLMGLPEYEIVETN